MVTENVRNCTKKSVNKLIPDESGWMQHVHQRHMPQSATHPRVLGWNHRLNQLEPSLFQDFTASRSKVSNDLLHVIQLLYILNIVIIVDMRKVQCLMQHFSCIFIYYTVWDVIYQIMCKRRVILCYVQWYSVKWYHMVSSHEVGLQFLPTVPCA